MTSTPEVLYHYTTQAGLLGIVESRTIWATKIHYLNDSTDFERPIGIANDLLVFDRPKSGGAGLAAVNALLEELGTIERVNVFVLSLSQEGDQLSQWRAYGGQVGGYSIGFDSASLQNLAFPHGFALSQCVYDEAQHRALISAAVDRGLEALGTSRGPTPESVQAIAPSSPEIPHDFEIEMTELAPLIKHSSFREEKEWRLVSVPKAITGDRIGFRCGRSFLIPHYELPILDTSGACAIREIVVGPGPHAELAQESTDLLLRRNEFEAINVRCSAIPLRNW